MKLFVWGTGNDCKIWLERFSEIAVCTEAFVDSNPQKIGTVFWGKKVISPEELNQFQFDYLVIASERYRKPITEHALQLFIEKEKLISMNELVKLLVSSSNRELENQILTDKRFHVSDNFYPRYWGTGFMENKFIREYRMEEVALRNLTVYFNGLEWKLGQYLQLPIVSHNGGEAKLDYEIAQKVLRGIFTFDFQYDFTILQNQMGSQYDIKKGIIIINQNDRVVDGNHRVVLLAMNHGLDYRITVLRITLLPESIRLL